MQIPDRIPGFKWLIVFWAVSAVVWSVLEGDFDRVLLFGFLTMFTMLLYFFQRFMAGQTLSTGRGLFFMGLWGLALGAGTALMTLFLMAVKTGLHGHGPEFTMAEVGAVGQQLPLWSLVGLLGGLGVGVLLIARSAE